MKNIYLLRILLLALAATCFSQCAKDKLDEDVQECVIEVTYIEGAREILDRTCAYAGCHDGFQAPGDFRTYDAMERYLNETDFEQRVINFRDMPPNYASGPKTLTEEEITIIRCWIENDYEE